MQRAYIDVEVAIVGVEAVQDERRQLHYVE